MKSMSRYVLPVLILVAFVGSSPVAQARKKLSPDEQRAAIQKMHDEVLDELYDLEPGDCITTGTPPGVGMGMKPQPRYLKAGDVIASVDKAMYRCKAELGGGGILHVSCDSAPA